MTIPTTLIVVDKRWQGVELGLGSMGSLQVIGCAVAAICANTVEKAGVGEAIVAVRSPWGMSGEALEHFVGDLHGIYKVPIEQIIKISSILNDERMVEIVRERVARIMARCEIESHA